jgi:hypothetical protein
MFVKWRLLDERDNRVGNYLMMPQFGHECAAVGRIVLSKNRSPI